MKTRPAIYLIAAALLSAAAAAPAPAQSTKDAPPTAQKPADAKRTGDPYPLATCPISGGKLGSMGKPIVKLYDGREVRFCCASCPPKFEKDLAKSLSTLDDAIIKDQSPLYPLMTSLVTGKDLPEKPYEFVYGNRLVRLGSETEKADFLKDAAKHLAALDAAVIAAQKKTYPLKTCPVSDEGLGEMGEPVDMVLAGRLVRLCCEGCAKDLEKNPAKFIAMVDAARAGTPLTPKTEGHDKDDRKHGGH